MDPLAAPLTLIDAEGDRTHEVAAAAAGAACALAPAALRGALGWELGPQGLCRGDTCVPVRDPARLATPAGIDLGELARVLERPLALDLDERVAVLGASAAARAARLRSLAAPDFALPDLTGKPHRLSDQRGKKTLLIAWASW